MLYNLKWLEPGQPFPPTCEADRINRYKQNALLFDGDHFADPQFRVANRHHAAVPVNVYLLCAKRISEVIGNFEDVVSFPTLLNYQRLMSLKMADLVCGEYPTITGGSSAENIAIKTVRDQTDFDSKLFTTVLDISRYGDALWRVYKREDNKFDFTCWDPCEWFPIIMQDGTNRIQAHVLCWIVDINENTPGTAPVYQLHAQIHRVDQPGEYEHRIYSMNYSGTTIQEHLATYRKKTGLDTCAVHHLKSYTVSNNVYGYDDYMPLDSLLAEIMARVGQISGILDKHADPNITGPTSMLSYDSKTGEYRLKSGKFFAVSSGEEHPEYMTWDGQLSSAFKQLEFLINQLYILSEMGAALLGGQSSGSQAISGTAMRFKMVNPLAKARRIANSLTRPVCQLLSSLTTSEDVQVATSNVSVFWADGLPDDPRENVEIAKLATGETRMMPLKTAIMEYFGRSDAEAEAWLQLLQSTVQSQEPDVDPNHPGPQDGTGVNPAKRGSETGLKDFHGLNNT